jgi:putative exosortase-associated protein (TIGR04073 family)
MLKRFLTILLLLSACVLCTGHTASAQNDIRVEDASPQEVVDAMANKLARGIANVATGWLELPKQIALTYHEEGGARAATVGTLKGIGMTVVRTVAGAGEAATFMVSYPGFFDPFLDPEYVWEKE